MTTENHTTAEHTADTDIEVASTEEPTPALSRVEAIKARHGLPKSGAGTEPSQVESDADKPLAAPTDADFRTLLDNLTKDSGDSEIFSAVKCLALIYRDLTPDAERGLASIVSATRCKVSTLKRRFRADVDELKAATLTGTAKVEPTAVGGSGGDKGGGDGKGGTGPGMSPSVRAALEAYNKRFAVITVGNSVKVAIFQDDGSLPGFVSKEGFFLKTLNERFLITETINGQTVTTWDRIAGRWLAWDGRRTLDRLIFRPYGFNDTAPADEALKSYNLWRGWGVEPVKGDWSLLKGHIFHNICRGNPYWFAWLMCWLADIVQEPQVKKGTAVVLKGRKGVGKSKLGDWIRELMPHNSNSIAKADQITGRFNKHQAANLFSVLEEALWAGDKSREGTLKDMITSPVQMIESKGVDATPIDNFTRYLMVSNEAWVVPASEDERRFFALGVNDVRQQDHVFFGAIDQQMENGGLEAMMYDLSRLVRPSWVNLRSPPRTPWLLDQISESLDVMHKWWGEVLAEGELILPETMAKAVVDPVNDPGLSYKERSELLEEARARQDAKTVGGHVPNVVTLSEDGPLVLRRSEAFESFKLFAKQHGGGRYMPTKAKLASFMEDMGASAVRPRVGETRTRVFEFSRTLDECREDFSTRFGGVSGFGSGDLEPDYSAMVPDTIAEAELDRWTAYGCSPSSSSEALP